MSGLHRQIPRVVFMYGDLVDWYSFPSMYQSHVDAHWLLYRAYYVSLFWCSYFFINIENCSLQPALFLHSWDFSINFPHFDPVPPFARLVEIWAEQTEEEGQDHTLELKGEFAFFLIFIIFDEIFLAIRKKEFRGFPKRTQKDSSQMTFVGRIDTENVDIDMMDIDMVGMHMVDMENLTDLSRTFDLSSRSFLRYVPPWSCASSECAALGNESV